MNEARIHWHPLTSTDIHCLESSIHWHPLKMTANQFSGSTSRDPLTIPGGSSRFQPGEGPSRGLLRDYEPSDLLRMEIFEALLCCPRGGGSRLHSSHTPQLRSLHTTSTYSQYRNQACSTRSSPTVANTDAFIKSKKQQSFSSQLAAELSWVLVLAGLVLCTATSAHLGGATVATSVVRLRVKPRHHRCGYTLRSRSHVYILYTV